MPIKIAGEPRLAGDKLNIVWEGAFFARHSLARVNRELILAMHELEPEWNFCIIPHPSDDNALIGDPQVRFIEQSILTQMEHVDIWMRHHWPPNWSNPGYPCVVMQPWEYGSIPVEWLEPMKNQVDQIWVYTNWIKQCYIQDGVPEDKIRVIPLGVADIFFKPASKMPLPTNKTFKFLFVGGTVQRKGVDALLSAYAAAFNRSDDATLIIKDFGVNSFYKDNFANKIIEFQQNPNNPELIYLTEDLTDLELNSLYRSCDCLVHPYRGEGFGLPIAEAMACGLPVIVTGYGAAMDFCDTNNSYLIPARIAKGNEKSISSMPTVNYPFWAEPDSNFLASIMRHVYENRDTAKEKGAIAAAYAAEKLTWKNSALAACKTLRKLNAATVKSVSKSVFSKLADKQRGLAKLNEQKFDEALKLLENALSAAPSDVEILNGIAHCKHALGRKDEAVKILDKALELNPSFAPSYYLTMAFFSAKEGDALLAASYARSALEADLKNTDAFQAAQTLKTHIESLMTKEQNAALRAQALLEITKLEEAIKKSLRVQSGQVEEPEIKPRISLCMIVKDEGHWLEQCLTSAKGIADEIIIVDTGSTDNTIDIAKAHGAQVYRFPWNDDFAAARNESLKYATGDWILHLDADEQIDEQSKKIILQAVKNPLAHGYEVSIRNYIDSTKKTEYFISKNLRLFRNKPQYRYVGRVHEHISGNIVKEGGKIFRQDDIVINHYGYNPEIMKQRSKSEKYLSLLKAEIERDPSDIHFMNHLAWAYYAAQDTENAISYLKKAIQITPKGHPFSERSYCFLANILTVSGRHKEALEEIDKAEKDGINSPELFYDKGLALIGLSKYNEAISAFQKAIELGKTALWVGDVSSYTYKSVYGIASAYFALNNFQKAAEFAQKALANNPDFIPAIELSVAAHAEMKQYQSAYNYAEKWLKIEPKNAKAHVFMGRIKAMLGDYETAFDCFAKALECDPQYSEAYFYAGDLMYELKDFERAAQTYHNGLEIDPKRPDMLVSLGNAYFQMGVPKAAILAYKQALAMDPNLETARQNLEIAQKTTGNQL